MGLEIAGNIGALLSGAVKGYQTQDELEIKKRALEEEKLLKQQAIEADLRKSGRIPSPDGGWVLSDEEKEKRELDSLYKQSQMELNKSRAKYYDEGGGGAGNLKIQSALVEKFQEVDPLTGNVKLSPLGEKRQQLILDAEKAKIAKLYGNISVPEAPSVAAKNRAEADAKRAAQIAEGWTIDPNNPNNLIAPKVLYTPLEQEMIKEAIKQGRKYDPRTGKIEKLWDVKVDKPQKEKSIKVDTITREAAKKLATWSTTHSSIKNTIEELKDPNKSLNEKINIGVLLAKNLNSPTMGLPDAVTGSEGAQSIGLIDPALNKYKWGWKPDVPAFIKKIEATNRILEQNIQQQETLLDQLESGKSVTDYLKTSNGPGNIQQPKDANKTIDEAKVARAKAVLNDPKAPAKAKMGAKTYLNSVGVK